MNERTTGEWAAGAARRFACVLTLVLLLSSIGVGRDLRTGAQGFALQVTSGPAQADTLAGELVDGDGYHETQLSTMRRHKTH
jgi:hypothetical protein